MHADPLRDYGDLQMFKEHRHSLPTASPAWNRRRGRSCVNRSLCAERGQKKTARVRLQRQEALQASLSAERVRPWWKLWPGQSPLQTKYTRGHRFLYAVTEWLLKHRLMQEK